MKQSRAAPAFAGPPSRVLYYHFDLDCVDSVRDMHSGLKVPTNNPDTSTPHRTLTERDSCLTLV